MRISSGSLWNCEEIPRDLVQHLSPESCRALRHALYSTLCNLPSTRSGSSCYGFSVIMYRGASCILHSTEPMQNLHLMLFVTTSLGLFILTTGNWTIDDLGIPTISEVKLFTGTRCFAATPIIGWVQALLASPRGLWFQSRKMNGNDEKLEMVGGANV